MRDEHIATIRAACFKANPEIRTTKTTNIRNGFGEKTGSHQRDTYRDIRLADVLLALPTLRSKMGHLNAAASTIVLRWNLRTDDLTQQSDETIAFIHSLLEV